MLATVMAGSWAVSGAVSERRVTPSEVAAAAAKIDVAQGFQVLTHERVVTAINERVGTPESRARLKQALERMKGHRPMVDEIFAQRKIPRVLIAVALQESGFDNNARTARPPAVQSAGLWQFIPATGRAMGLEVTAARDERLDPRRATLAAAGLLEKLHRQFGDWPLAIAAYNGGSKLIESLTAGLSRDEARRKLIEDDREFGRYLVGVMAAVILVENPALLD